MAEISALLKYIKDGEVVVPVMCLIHQSGLCRNQLYSGE